MMRISLFFFFLSTLYADQPVLITSVMSNQAHLIPRYLQNIEKLDYDKKQIALHFYTYNNSDNTFKLLDEWVKNNKEAYKQVVLESFEFANVPETPTYLAKEFNFEEKKMVSELKNKGLQKTKEYGCAYYFYLSPISFIAPYTLKELIAKDKPIVAPLLKSIPDANDHFANFFYKVDENGYYAHDPEYMKILFRWIKGTYKVPLVYNAYLVKAEYIDKLNYYEFTLDCDFITFAKKARESGIDQYICNDKEYGVQIHFVHAVSIDDEKQRLKNILLLP